MTMMTDENMRQLFESLGSEIAALGGYIQSSNKASMIIAEKLDSIDSTLGVIAKAIEIISNKE